MLTETIDVTKYIESGEFVTDSCESRLDRLIRTKPYILENKYETQLQRKLELWKQNHNKWQLKNKRDSIGFDILDLVEKTKYQYSYFITTEPIDVYRTDTDIKINENKNLMLFLQIDKDGIIISEYKESGWVLNNCDSTNSITQD